MPVWILLQPAVPKQGSNYGRCKLLGVCRFCCIELILASLKVQLTLVVAYDWGDKFFERFTV